MIYFFVFLVLMSKTNFSLFISKPQLCDTAYTLNGMKKMTYLEILLITLIFFLFFFSVI